MLVNDVLEFVGATLDRLSPARAQDLARRLAATGEGREQAGRLAQELVDWSQRNAERVRDLVRREVTAQLASAGVATKGDLDALETRLRRLERSAAAAERARRKGGSDAKRASGESPSKGSGSSASSTGASAGRRASERATPPPPSSPPPPSPPRTEPGSRPASGA